MWPDWVSNLGPLALESDELLIALHGPAVKHELTILDMWVHPVLSHFTKGNNSCDFLFAFLDDRALLKWCLLLIKGFATR